MNLPLRSTLGGLLCLVLTIGILVSGNAAIEGRSSSATPNLVLETPMTGEMDDAIPAEDDAAVPATGDDAVPAFPGETDEGRAADPATSPVTSAPLPPPQAGLSENRKDAAPSQSVDDGRVETVLRHPVALAAGLVDFEGRQVRLDGLKPQSPDRRCRGAKGDWPCGMLARTAFRNFLRARPLVCRTPAEGWSGVLATRCTVGGDDPALWLAENGWAEVEPGAPLAETVETAKALGKGFYRPATAPDPRLRPTTDPTAIDPMADDALAGTAPVAGETMPAR
ncbi:thermonuclease family protein [Rhizobium sp. YIM 134829]|uniref:thermonuclease family protein n=1 Tax=Rhizobium sp. YIM 134829 TaxID=3390453 RepID=UPI00397CABFA